MYEAGQLPTSTNTNVLYRVDAGGPAISAIDNGPDWMADQSDSDPGAAYRNHQSNTALWSPVSNVDSTVPSSTPSAIFNSERWSPTDNPPMTWDFPVPSGTQVEVRLYFANRYSGTSQPGQRVFDVSLNGTQVLTHYDIVASVGDQTGTMQAFDITVPSTGTYASDVDLAFTHEVENPLIDGIEIVKTGSSATPPGTDNVDTLAYRAMSGTKIGPLTTVPTSGHQLGLDPRRVHGRLEHLLRRHQRQLLEGQLRRQDGRHPGGDRPVRRPGLGQRPDRFRPDLPGCQDRATTASCPT